MRTIRILCLPGDELDQETFEQIWVDGARWSYSPISGEAGPTPLVYSAGGVDVLFDWSEPEVAYFRRLYKGRSMLTLRYEDEKADEIEARINRNAVSLAFTMD